MAGNLVSTPTQFTALSVGSGHSTGGTDYPGGSPVYAIKYSIVTVVGLTLLGTQSQTTDLPVSGFTVGDWVAAEALASGFSTGVMADIWMKSSGTATLQLSNVSSASAVQIATPFLLQCVKVVP